MPIAFDPTRPWEYILKEDRGTEKPTRFHLIALDVGDEAALQDRLVAVDGATKTTRVATGSHALEILRAGLVGWDDFFDAGGNAVPFDVDKSRRMRGRDPVSDASLKRLSPKHRTELADAITERNTIAEDEAKNC